MSTASIGPFALKSDMIRRKLGHVPLIAACDSALEAHCGEAGHSAIIAMDLRPIAMIKMLSQKWCSACVLVCVRVRPCRSEHCVSTRDVSKDTELRCNLPSPVFLNTTHDGERPHSSPRTLRIRSHPLWHEAETRVLESCSLGGMTQNPGF